MPSVDDLPPPPSGIDDLPPPPGPGMFADSVKSTIDSLPMIGATAGAILATPADAVAPGLANMGGAFAGGYVGTAAKNLINKYYDPNSAPKTTTAALIDPMIGGANQASMQGAADFAAPYVAKGLGAAADAVSSGTKWAATKALSNLGGVSPSTIKEYAQFSDRINAAPSIDKLKDISDEFVGKLASDVEAKKITAQQAQDAYNAHLSDLKEAYKSAGYDARDAVASAQQTVKDAHNAKLEQTAGDVYDTVNQLKNDVQSGSQNALGILDKSDAVIDTSPVAAHIDEQIAALKKAGTDESLAVADRLSAYKQRLMDSNGSGLVPASDAKKLIQGIDRTTTYSPMAGSFDTAKNAAFKGVRSVLDQSVKDAVPEYAQAMQGVSSDAGLLNRVQDFGDKQGAASILGRISAPNQLERRAALQELGDKYGADFVSAADPANLPEQKLLQRAQAAQSALRPDRVSQNIDQTMAGSRQQAEATAAQSALEKSQQNLSPFKSLAPNAADQTTAQQKLQQLASGKNIELTDMFTRLGKLTNTNFVQAMKDQGTLAAFQKGATNGSRNTLIGAVAGWAFGGEHGAVIGAGAGRAVDQYGPVITKKILDGAIRVSKSPIGSAASTIASLELPSAVKQNMVYGLENYMAKSGSSAPAQMVAQNQGQPNRSPAKGPDAWAQQGLKSLGIQDPGLSQRLLADPKAKQLLIQASDLKPGSKAHQKIMSQIQKGWAQ